MALFSETARSDTRPSGHSENKYAFLDRVAGSYWQQIRDVLEYWISGWPKSDQPDLIGRLKKGEESFDSALLELYCRQMLLSLGYTVYIHPPVPGTERRPDFLAQSPGHGFYLEARTVRSPLDSSERGNHENVIYDALNRIDSPNFP